MHPMVTTRRAFISTASCAAAAITLLPRSIRAASNVSPTQWPIGCFNRPWTKWSFDETLDAIKGAGYRYTGLLSTVIAKGDVFTGSTATPEYLAALKEKIAARGL